MLATGTQRDNYLDDLMRTDALLEHAVRHGMTEGASERFLEETKDLMGRTNPPELLDSIGRECELLCNSAESLGRAIIGEILRSQCGHTILEEQRRRVSRSSASARNRAGKGATRPDRGAVRVLAAELVV